MMTEAAVGVLLPLHVGVHRAGRFLRGQRHSAQGAARLDAGRPLPLGRLPAPHQSRRRRRRPLRRQGKTPKNTTNKQTKTMVPLRFVCLSNCSLFLYFPCISLCVLVFLVFFKLGSTRKNHGSISRN